MKYESAVMDLYNQGIYSGPEIARRLGITGNRVWDVFIKHGDRKSVV